MLPTLEVFTCIGFSYGVGMIKGREGGRERQGVCAYDIFFSWTFEN